MVKEKICQGGRRSGSRRPRGRFARGVGDPDHVGQGKAIIFKLGITVDFWTPYTPMLVFMTLTLMQGHSGSDKATTKISVACSQPTEKAISVKLALQR